MKLSTKQLVKVEETLKDFICLVPRYLEVKDNPVLYDMFLSRNRNPLFDLTLNKFWETGLSSNGFKSGQGKKVKDHYIPRKLAMGFIMRELSLNPNISLEEFIVLCKKYASTINLTEEEHKLVTQKAKKTGKPNYEFYESCGIVVEGLIERISLL
jgi:hypothetical protein